MSLISKEESNGCASCDPHVQWKPKLHRSHTSSSRMTTGTAMLLAKYNKLNRDITLLKSGITEFSFWKFNFICE